MFCLTTLSTHFIYGQRGRGKPSYGVGGQADGIAMKGAQSNVKWGAIVMPQPATILGTMQSPRGV